MNLRGKLRELLGLDLIARGVAEGFADVRRDEAHAIRTLERIVALEPKPPPAFVCVLVEGLVETRDPVPHDFFAGGGRSTKGRRRPPPAPAAVWKPATLGQSRYIERSDTFDLSTNRPIRDARVIVFADLSRVAVQLFIGIDLVSQAIGDCPIGFVANWQPGVQLRVSCNLRGSR